MAIRVALHHLTEYQYDRPVTLFPHVIRLRPAPHCRTPIVSHSLRVEPKDQFLNWAQDPYSNYLARLVFPEAAREFSVEVIGEAAMDSVEEMYAQPIDGRNFEESSFMGGFYVYNNASTGDLYA